MNDEIAIRNELLVLLHSDSLEVVRIEQITPSIWEEVIGLAAKQHVDCYLYYRLKQAGLAHCLPLSLNEKLSDKWMRYTMRNLSLIAQMKEISRVLHARGISVIALKGLQMAQTIYPHIGTRYLRDMDLLIPINRVKEVYESVRNLGYESEKEPTDLDFLFKYNKHLPQQFHPQKKTIIELHGYIEASQGSFDELSDEAVHADEAEYSHLFLSIDELLIHLCTHISYSDLFKIDLRHYLDIYLLLNRYGDEIEWEIVLKKADMRGKIVGLLSVIAIVSHLFKYELPLLIADAIMREPKIDHLTEPALEFLWMYDKTSVGYNEYKAETAGILKPDPLVMLVFKRLFITKEEIAYKYGLETGTLRIYLYYFVRLWGMFRDNTHNTFKNRIDGNAKDFVYKTRQVHIHLFGEC